MKRTTFHKLDCPGRGGRRLSGAGTSSRMWLGILVLVACACAPAAWAEGTGDVVELTAFTVPSKQLDLASSRGGVIGKLFVEDGDPVKKGDRLVELKCEVERAQLEVSEAEYASAQAALDAAKAQVETTKREFERIKGLHEDGVEGESLYDKYALEHRLAELTVTTRQDQKRVLKLKVELWKQRVAEMSIMAPADGEVLQVIKHEGEAVDENEPLVRLVNVEVLDVVAFTPLAKIQHIREGVKGTFTVEGLADVSVPCEVFLVDSVADAASGTFRIKAKIDNAGRRVPAGVRGVLRIETPSESK